MDLQCEPKRRQISREHHEDVQVYKYLYLISPVLDWLWFFIAGQKCKESWKQMSQTDGACLKFLCWMNAFNIERKRERNRQRKEGKKKNNWNRRPKGNPFFLCVNNKILTGIINSPFIYFWYLSCTEGIWVHTALFSSTKK